MHTQDILHTLDILETIESRLPPLVDKQTRTQLAGFCQQLRGRSDLTLEKLESLMIEYGKKIWPYYQAFHHLLNAHARSMGDTFLLSLLRSDIKKRYRQFKKCGGGYFDLKSGEPMNFFELEHRPILAELVVRVEKSINEFARMRAVGLERQIYLDLISAYEEKLTAIEDRLRVLRRLAEQESSLRAEIESCVKEIELGFCFLAPSVDYNHVMELEEFFQERKGVKNIMRLIYA